MQAIITAFLPPTNTRGSRYKASCEAGSITLSADCALNAEENHKAARTALCCKLASVNKAKYGTVNDPWTRPMVSGQIPSGEYVHVFLEG